MFFNNIYINALMFYMTFFEMTFADTLFYKTIGGPGLNFIDSRKLSQFVISALHSKVVSGNIKSFGNR